VAVSRPLAAGAALYAFAAVADAVMTVRGLGGDLALEGNAGLRGLMERIGIVPALVVEKSVVALACLWIAWFVAPEIRRGASWIERVPSTPWARAWMRRGDRSWIAYIPLYGTALLQLFAALLWALI
jgi:hypothetical protein